MPTTPAPYIWGVKPENQQFPRKRKATLLEEMLVEFPDPKNLIRTGNKYEDIVECMRERHKEQRQRLFDRHKKELDEWKDDTQKAIDYDTSFKYYFPLTHPAAIMLPESVQLISTPGAKAALQRLPKSRRNVIVSIEQLEMPPNLSEKDDYRYKELTHPEIAAEIAKQGVAMRNQMRQEEQDMRIYQHEAISIFLQALERNFPGKYGKHGSNAQLHQNPPIIRSSGPSFISSVPRSENLNRSYDPRRPPVPIPIPKGPGIVSSANTPRSSVFPAVGERDMDMQDAPQTAQVPQPQLTAAPNPIAPSAPAQPGVSRDPRKPPPPFNLYALREEATATGLPPQNHPNHREEPIHSTSNPYGRREELAPPTGPLNPHGRREGREDLYSRRENIQPPQRAVAYSNSFYSKQSPISPSLHTGGRSGQSPGSPASEHDGRRTSAPMSRQGSGGSLKQSPVVVREGVVSRWDVSSKNADDIDSGEAAWQRRKSMSGHLGR